MVEQSPNHGFEIGYEEGDEPWEYNAEFEALEELVPIRDEEAQLGQYEPHDGARFVSTDTGAVFEGDGTAWVFGTRDFAEMYEDGDRVATRPWVDGEFDSFRGSEQSFEADVTFEQAAVFEGDPGGNSAAITYSEGSGLYLTPDIGGQTDSYLRYHESGDYWRFHAETRVDGLRSYALSRFQDTLEARDGFRVYEPGDEVDYLSIGWSASSVYLHPSLDAGGGSSIWYDLAGDFWQSEAEFRVEGDVVAIDGDTQPPEVHGNEAHDSDFAYDGAEQPPESHDNTAHLETYAVDGDEQPPEAHGLGGPAHTAATLTELNALVSDATLDDESDSRPPDGHGNEAHTETFAVDGDAQPPESHDNTAHLETYAVDGDAQPPESHGNAAHDVTFAEDGDEQPPESHDNTAHSVVFVETNETDLEIQIDGTDGPGIINFKTE